MFNSQSTLLSSKGPLGAIWVAGYFFKRLKKHQIIHTDISSSVATWLGDCIAKIFIESVCDDKILLEGLPSVTYRILAYLLLGVVRIYSKKVDYLFQDCHDTVSDIKRFSVGKKAVSFRDIVRSTTSITLPESYELDSFQLEVVDGPSRSNIARRKDICLKADVGKDVFSHYTLDKQQFEEVSTLWEDLIDPQTSHGDIMQQETCSFSQTPDKVTADERETSTSGHTPPGKVLSPHQMELDVEVSCPDHMKKFSASKEKLRELRFAEEDGMDVDRICELDVELINLINDYQVQTTDDLDEDGLKKTPIENHQECVTVKEKEAPSATESTPESEVEDAEVGTSPELMIVPTPVKKENTRRPGKRKCIIDEATVLSNEIMKQCLKDASSLVCKKRKAPHTVTDLWRFHRILALSKNFSAPLVPCIAFEDVEYIPCGKKTERTELSTQLTVEIIETKLAPPTKQPDIVTTSAPADSPFAPGTPVQCPLSARVFESAREGDSDGEGAQFYGNIRKEFSMHEEDSPDPSLMAEMDANGADNGELQKNKRRGLSARTRSVARYLQRIIQSKKQRGEEGATLLPIVERKTKRENAMLFFELLVLSTRGMINVVQEKAYGDVLLQETPQLEAHLKKC